MRTNDPKKIFDIIATFCALGSIAGFFGRIWWIIDLTSHFRAQYAFGLGICAIAFLWMKRWRVAAVAIIFSLINVVVIAPYYMSPNDVIKKGSVTNKIRLATINVFTPNTAYAKVIDFIKKENPDLVALLEVSPVWIEELLPLEKSYPYRLVLPQNDNFGIALYSKLTPISMKRIAFGGVPIPSIIARFEHAGHVLNITVTHLLPPSGPNYSRANTLAAKGIVKSLKGESGATVILGDLNATPWSETHKLLIDGLSLRNGRKGHGIQPTWPSWLPFLRIPIDHCLVSNDLSVLDHRLGTYLGSDHIPLVVDLVIRR